MPRDSVDEYVQFLLDDAEAAAALDPPNSYKRAAQQPLSESADESETSSTESEVEPRTRKRRSWPVQIKKEQSDQEDLE